MAAGDDLIRAEEELWSSLPADLLGMVYVRLVSPFDRLRFAAVCTSWRAFSSTYPPRPVLPFLMLDPRGGDQTKQVYCPDYGTALPRVPVPTEAAGGCFVGGYDDGWVISSEAPIGIMNLFSGFEVVYSPEQKRIIRTQQSTGDLLVMRKVVFSTAPTSRGCILAAITDKHGLALCGVSCPEYGWTTQKFYRDERLVDISFCNGELYGLMRYRNWLLKFEISVNQVGTPELIAVHRLTFENNLPYWRYTSGDAENYIRYIVELRGKLLMVARNCFNLQNLGRSSFKVFELVERRGDGSEATYMYRWMSMTSLGNHALFVGPTCSTAVHVPESGNGGVRRNHVYYCHHRCLRRGEDISKGIKVFLTSSTDDGDRVYYKGDDSVNSGVEQITYVEYLAKGGSRPPMWLLPPNI